MRKNQQPHSIAPPQRWIRLRGVRTNNLRNVDVDIPQNQMIAITGVSGSGKSSLAFDTLYAEGQRRFVDSLSTYTRQFLDKIPRPDVDSIENICPAIALEQKNHTNNSRSTVATQSELYDYLRLLYARIGRTRCTQCGQFVQKDTPHTSVNKFLGRVDEGSRIYILAPCAPEVTRDSLRTAGFERVLFEEQIISVDELPKTLPKTKAPNTLQVVIDRLSIQKSDPEARQRLTEAMQQAFELGQGHARIAVVDGDHLRYHNFSDRFRCDDCALEYPILEPHHFSFNSPVGACDGCSGFGFNLELDEALIVPDPLKSIRAGAIDPFTKPAYRDWHEELMRFCELHQIRLDSRYADLNTEQRELIWNGDNSKGRRKFKGIRGCFAELAEWKYKLHVRVFIRRFQSPMLCSQCHGSRLRPDVKNILLQGSIEHELRFLPLTEVLRLSIEHARQFFESLQLTPAERTTVRDLMPQICDRLAFLEHVGVGYLTLDRLARTLSGGECQRIHLATQLGNRLCSTLYVLDEPSIGLHPEDTTKLIDLLTRLRDHGNTVVLVEHDLEMIRASDYLIEIGPHAGSRGGTVTAQGWVQDPTQGNLVLQNKACLTAKYMDGTFFIPPRQIRRSPSGKVLKLTGACENNLNNLTVEIPLEAFTAVTGLSGSGKTTLIHQTLYRALARVFKKTLSQTEVPGKYHRLYGVEHINDVVLLDQTPIGRSSRSNPATFMKIYDEIRALMANQSLSLRRGYAPGHFSFNVDGGRCPTCKGEGEITLDMHFMADLTLPCEDCDGKKFKRTLLEVEFRGKNINAILGTTVDDAVELFRDYPNIVLKLQHLRSVGLGYLTLGQSSKSLSGGESQRLKIAAVLQRQSMSQTLFIFDEPTTGLHLEDVKKLLGTLHDLVDERNTVLVIEHNLHLISSADWVIDLGPGGGSHGGNLVGCGTPAELARNAGSLTGKHLASIENV